MTALLLGLSGAALGLGADAVRVVPAAVGCAALGGIAGVLPVWLALGGTPHQFVTGFLGGLMARFAVTGLAALVAFQLLDGLPRMSFGVWVGVAQLVVLAVDTAMLLRFTRAGQVNG